MKREAPEFEAALAFDSTVLLLRETVPQGGDESALADAGFATNQDRLGLMIRGALPSIIGSGAVRFLLAPYARPRSLNLKSRAAGLHHF